MINDIAIGDEVWINGDEWTGYVVFKCEEFIIIENYDMQKEKIPVKDIKKVKIK